MLAVDSQDRQASNCCAIGRFASERAGNAVLKLAANCTQQQASKGVMVLVGGCGPNVD